MNITNQSVAGVADGRWQHARVRNMCQACETHLLFAIDAVRFTHRILRAA